MEKRSRTDLNRQKRPLWNVQNEPSSSQSEHFFFLVLFLRERLTNTNDVTSPRFSSLGTGSDYPGRVPSGHLWSFELPRYGDRLLPLSVTGCVFFFLYLDEHNHEIFPLREMTARFRLIGKGAKETEREGSPEHCGEFTTLFSCVWKGARWWWTQGVIVWTLNYVFSSESFNILKEIFMNSNITTFFLKFYNSKVLKLWKS